MRLLRRVTLPLSILCAVVAIVALLIPFRSGDSLVEHRTRQCGSVLLVSQEETLSGDDAVLGDWLGERNCRVNAAGHAFTAALAGLVGGAALALRFDTARRHRSDPN